MSRYACRAVFPAWFLCLAICVSATGSEPAKDAAGPKPPVLKLLRWQQLDTCYQDVFIDGSGRAWFLATTPNDFARPKWAYLVCPELPDKPIQMPGTNVPLGFDGRNRFWEIGHFGLCATDVHHDVFLQRRPTDPNKGLSNWTWRRDSPLPFVPVMFEHSSGRLYFFDAEGVHILDGQTWSYHKLVSLEKADAQHPSPLLGARAAEGPRGEVYVWIWRSQGEGLWLQDGAEWKFYATTDYPALRLAEDIFPQADGTLRVCGLGGREGSVTLPGRPWQPPAAAKKRDRLRETRMARLCHAGGGPSLADFTGGELAACGRFLAEDAQGRVYYVALPPSVGIDMEAHFGQIAVFDPRYPEDAPTLKYESVRLIHDWHAVRLDSEGRLWARLCAEEHPHLSRYDGHGWTHFDDPTAPPSGQPPRGGKTNFGFLQALLGGGMVAGEMNSSRAHLFDGKTWTYHDSFRDLVEDKFAWLKENIDNTAEPYHCYGDQPALGRDATGRVWLCEGAFSGAYDGAQWGELPKGGFRLNKAGDRAAVGGALRDSSVWPPKGLIALPGPIWFGRGGDIWAGEHRYSGDRFLKVDYSRGGPILEDSAGRIWLSGWYHWPWVFPAGQASGRLPHDLGLTTPAIEQGRGVFWAFTDQGLLRLRVEAPKGGIPKMVVDKNFPRLVPQDRIEFFGLDKYNNLWLATRFGGSGLYRIELPPREEKKP